jgi:hypothetical protein
MLPIWLANHYVFEQYTEKGILGRSGDGGIKYQSDADFLNDCLIYTLLTNQNKCSKNCEIYKYGFSIFNKKIKHKEILSLWQNIFLKTNTYGLDNVMKECDTYTKTNKGNVYDDAELHNWILELKEKLKKFYIDNIREKMLEYELVK